MSITHVQIVSIPVSDQARSRAFYTDVLGFEVRSEAPFGEGMTWLELAPPGSATSVALVTWFDRMPPGGVHGLVLHTDNITNDYAVLRGRGLEFGGEITEEFWGTFATFEDPDGNGWVLSQGPNA